MQPRNVKFTVIITHKLVLATVNQHNKIHVSNFTHCKDDCDQTVFGDVCYLQAILRSICVLNLMLLASSV